MLWDQPCGLQWLQGSGQPWPCKIFPGSWLVSYSYTGAHVLFTPFRWHFWVHLGWSARCQMSDSGFYPPCSAATAPGWPAHRMWTHQGQVAAFFQRMKRWCTWHPPEKPCGKTSSTPHGDAGRQSSTLHPWEWTLSQTLSPGVWCLGRPFERHRNSFSPPAWSFALRFAFSLWWIHHDYKEKPLDFTYLKVLRKTTYFEDHEAKAGGAKPRLFTFHKIFFFFSFGSTQVLAN